MDGNSLTSAAIRLWSHLNGGAIKQVDFARAVGISPSFLNDILKGAARPSYENAERIQHETGGAVTLDMWTRRPEGGDDAQA